MTSMFSGPNTSPKRRAAESGVSDQYQVCAQRSVLRGADAGNGGQHLAARPEDAMEGSDCGGDVVHQMKCLRDHQTVERGRRNLLTRGQIGDDGRLWRAGIDVQDVRPRDARTPETARVRAVPDLQDSAADGMGVRGEEALYVVAV